MLQHGWCDTVHTRVQRCKRRVRNNITAKEQNTRQFCVRCIIAFSVICRISDTTTCTRIQRRGRSNRRRWNRTWGREKSCTNVIGNVLDVYISCKRICSTSITANMHKEYSPHGDLYFFFLLCVTKSIINRKNVENNWEKDCICLRWYVCIHSYKAVKLNKKESINISVNYWTKNPFITTLFYFPHI